VAIDGFGTGGACLAYMKHAPIQRLKIGRSSVEGLLTDLADAGIVRCAIVIAKNLVSKVIVEAVETVQHAEMLHEERCDKGHGFHGLDASAGTSPGRERSGLAILASWRFKPAASPSLFARTGYSATTSWPFPLPCVRRFCYRDAA